MAVARVVRGISRFKKTRITDPSSCPSIPFLFVFFLIEESMSKLKKPATQIIPPF